MRAPLSRLALLVLGIGLLACSGLGGKDDDEEEEDEEEQSSGDSPEDVCAEMLECAAAVEPGSEEALESTYGADGTCWSGDMETAVACGDACESALATYAEAWPDEPACNGGGGDTGTPTDGCALESGLWDLMPTLEYDTCGVYEEDIERSWSVEIDCYDAENGRFTFTGFLSADPVECVSSGRDFSCAASGDFEAAASGTASGGSASGDWGLAGDCEVAGTFEMTL